MADLTLGQHPLLKKPFLDARFKDLTEKRFIADSLFMKVSADALAVKYFKDADVDSEGRYNYEEVPEVGEGSGYKRIGLSEVAKIEMIRKYGLEAAISYEMQKWGQAGVFERIMLKLSNSVVAMVNTMAYEKIHSEPNIGGRTKTGAAGDETWDNATLGADKMISDIIDAKASAKKFGYSLDTMVISTETEALFLKNKGIRDALRENNTDIALLNGYIGNFLGLDVIVDENYSDDQVLMLQRGIIGDIADAEPLKSHTYNQEEDSTTILRVSRFTTAYITDPKAVYLLKNIKA
ncbi:TPA: hypothetical protein QCU10_004265 [Bacillus anthracis]|uniref:phage major capsid protein n=1 Tax=Bacillus anthracis TaxID=1392 RepID=UPI0001DBF4DB|nr:hypothetical protein [Bacillus cereus]HDR4495429.1 hypothetical protein [Bacillus cereus biovar anthracis]ADK05068.1 hypothetical protein BACI_c24270 [Bacillus cereus biovar anthracis str. CI]HDR6229521.1 hypothetical protein [Bacillus cereus biovar anthracis]HDR6234362.1 hypothetical protein [Bacillus cereus biovar anthracis]HDR6240560.1 hypothetical protein [Bacillus cereus biovar anthracis]